MAAEAVAEAKPPAGVASLYLTDDTCRVISVDKAAAKHGDLFRVAKSVILDDIQKKGAISDFHPAKAQLSALPLEEVLMRYNDNDIYRDSSNFEVCLTEAGQEAIMQQMAAAEEAAAPPKPKPRPEPKKREPKPWIHLGSDKEIGEEQVHTSRGLIVVRATRKRKEFGAPATFTDRDAMETFSSGQMECRPFKDPAYDKSLAEQDVAVQSIPVTKHCAAQTVQEVPRNNCVQYQPRELDEESKKSILTSDHMCNFLDSAKPRYTYALQQNEAMDLFEDDFAGFGEEDEHVGQKAVNVITEFQAFSDLVYSKGKMISAIDWMPRKKGVVAAACSDSKPYDERLQIAGIPSNSFVLIWSFVDPINPQIILESLSDIFCLRFNPSNPRFIAGGCYNGQVILWDISAAQMLLETKEKDDQPVQPEQTTTKDKEKKPKAPIVICHLLSSAATSHSAIVSDLHWLPENLQVDETGTVSSGHSQIVSVLLSVGADGKVVFWNITRESQGEPDPENERKAAEIAADKYRWSPTFAVSLYGNAPPKTMGLLRLSLSLDSRFFCSTEFGEVLRADFDGVNEKYVEEISQSHFGQVRALQRSPFFEDIILSVDIWTFALWKDYYAKPIFISRSAEGYLTTGCWSPTRPGVLYIGRIDGSIEVWDLIDHSHQPATSASIGSCQVTSMEFWPLSAAPQMLAVGDIQGILHIMEIPRRLRRMVHREKSMVRKFLDRQQSWVEDVESREKQRVQEIEKRQNTEVAQKRREEQLVLFAMWDENKENEYLAFEKECRQMFESGNLVIEKKKPESPKRPKPESETEPESQPEPQPEPEPEPPKENNENQAPP